MLADRENVKEIEEIVIDESKPVEDRVKDYLEQVDNPFLIKVGEYILKLEYADCDKSIEDRMIEYLSKMAQIRY